jgi:hypothetical protein
MHEFSQLPQYNKTSYSYISCHIFLSLYWDTAAHIKNFQDDIPAYTVNVILYTNPVPTKVPPTHLLQNKPFLPSNRSTQWHPRFWTKVNTTNITTFTIQSANHAPRLQTTFTKSQSKLLIIEYREWYVPVTAMWPPLPTIQHHNQSNACSNQ